MNVVPRDGVVGACRHRPSNRKNESPVEGFLQKLDNFAAFFVVREVGDAREPDWVVRPARMRVFRTLNSRRKMVMNFNRAAVLVSSQTSTARADVHVAADRLCSDFLSVYAFTLRTLKKCFPGCHFGKAELVERVVTSLQLAPGLIRIVPVISRFVVGVVIHALLVQLKRADGAILLLQVVTQDCQFRDGILIETLIRYACTL